MLSSSFFCNCLNIASDDLRSVNTFRRLIQRWTWVGTIHGSGWVGLGHKILRLGWVGLDRVQCQKYVDTYLGDWNFKHILVQRKLIFFTRLLIIKNKNLKSCLAHYVETNDFYGLCSTYSIVTSAEHIKMLLTMTFTELFFDVA